MADETIILAIESAVRGGSIALGRGGEIIDIWIGEGGVSRAEDLLFNIDAMLKRSGVDKRELGRMVVSVGPGSFTGIRIGLATAMGLAAALEIDLAKYSLLDAMAATSAESITTAVPVGRGVVCMQSFRVDTLEIRPLGKPTAISLEDFERIDREVIKVITIDDLADGPAACLMNTACDPRIPQADEPLFVAKPASI